MGSRWETQSPTRISEDVRLELARRFSPDDVDDASATLGAMTLPLDDSQANRDRVHLAAILRSGGSLSALRDAVALAETDWRDLLVAAGLENSDWRDVLRKHGIAIP
jgi:hypothetical protein